MKENTLIVIFWGGFTIMIAGIILGEIMKILFLLPVLGSIVMLCTLMHALDPEESDRRIKKNSYLENTNIHYVPFY